MHPVIIHCHIFKNAGTTFAETLSRNFGDHAIDQDRTNNPDEKLVPAEIQKIIESYGNKIKSITSHRFILPPPTSSIFRPLPVVLLRQPVDRAVSAYYFWRNWKDSRRKEAKLAQKQTLREYFEDLDKDLRRAEFFSPYKNEQTRFACSCLDRRREITEEDFKKACENLRLCFFVGESDMYNKSMVILEEKLKPFFSKIDLSYIKSNTTPGRKDTLDKRLEDARNDLGEELYNRLNRANEFDLKLVRMNRRLLEEQIKQIPDFEEKLIDFRRRCRLLESKS